MPEAKRNRTGVFTLSLDCEGLWGMADQAHVLNRGVINGKSLRRAYTSVHSTLESNGVRATAAFVSCFAAPRDAVREYLPLLEELGERNPEWFCNLLPILRRGDSESLDGWEGNDLWNEAASRGHEIAWHGATHMPLSDATASEAIELELRLASHLFKTLGRSPTSVVFPRNLIGHLIKLRSAGFSCYRERASSGPLGRVGGLLREFNLFDRSVNAEPRRDGSWAVSPAGFFLNWPSGIRSSVPVGVTVQRWRCLLRHAALKGGYVHMWFHPHNLITAPAMQESFNSVMLEVGNLVRSGDLLSLTMAEASTYYGLN